MTKSLFVGFMGAGAIGCFVGGVLASRDHVEITLVGRRYLEEAINQSGLRIGRRDGHTTVIHEQQCKVAQTADALAHCDVVFVCTKSAQTAQVARDLRQVLRPDAIVVSLQNGVRNVAILNEHLSQTVLTGVVEFNVRWSGPAHFTRTTNGPLVVQSTHHPNWQRVAKACRKAGLELEETDDIQTVQWTKLIVNLNNAISALSGVPIPQMLASEYRFVVAAVAQEGIEVLRQAGKRPGRFRGIPIAWMPTMLRLPLPVVRLLTRAQLKADASARSSMWEDLEKRRQTEVDHLNGEIVHLAQKLNVAAPINSKVVTLVREAAAKKEGSPNLSADTLRRQLGI